jgi:hypothetical protein
MAEGGFFQPRMADDAREWKSGWGPVSGGDLTGKMVTVLVVILPFAAWRLCVRFCWFLFAGIRGIRGWVLARQRSAVASANEVTMRTTSESLSPFEASHGREAKGNCVAVRRGGEQPEAKPQTQTQVKPIRPPTMAS